MGVAARKLTTSGRGRGARLSLRVVPVRSVRRPQRRARSAAEGLFRISAVCITVVALVAMARVSVAVQASEAAVDAGTLRDAIKTEQRVTDGLEVDKSSLASPSRLEGIACVTLDMQKPAEVSYIDLPVPGGTQPEPPVAQPAVADSGAEEGRGLFATVMDLAAGEAKAMLVGDMGLGSP